MKLIALLTCKQFWLISFVLVSATVYCRASRTVIDETGQQVVVPGHPHRVICLVPSVVDIAYAIGAENDVVGVSDYVTYPVAATKKPVVGTILTPSFETIVSLKPDLLLAIKTESGSAAVQRFHQMGIPLFLVDPHGIEGILRSVTSLGEVLDRRFEAKREVLQLQGRLDAVKHAVEGKPIVTVFLPIWYDPVITIGKGAFLTELIAAAGGRSITDDLISEWPQVSLETVVARQPNALLLGRGRVTLDVLRKRPGWQEMSAVREGKVYFINSKMDLASPVAFDGLEELARELHP